MHVPLTPSEETALMWVQCSLGHNLVDKSVSISHAAN